MGVLYARVNGQWQPVNFSASDRWNNAWGAVATAVVTTSQFGIGSTITDLAGLSVTFAPVVGRRYRTIFSIMANLNTAGRVIVPQIADAANGVLQQGNQSIQSPGYFQVHLEVIESFASTAAVTRKAKIGVDVAGATIDTVVSANYPAFICVEDIGPVAGAIAIPNPTPAWVPLTLLNGFSNLGSGYLAAAARVLGDMGQVRGTLTRAGAISGSLVLAQLPAGCRPPGTYIYATWASMNAAAVRGAVRLMVDSSGQITFDPTYGLPSGTTNGAITGVDHINLETQFSVTP